MRGSDYLLLLSNTTILFRTSKNENSMMELFCDIGEADEQTVKALYGLAFTRLFSYTRYVL